MWSCPRSEPFSCTVILERPKGVIESVLSSDWVLSVASSLQDDSRAFMSTVILEGSKNTIESRPISLHSQISALISP